MAIDAVESPSSPSLSSSHSSQQRHYYLAVHRLQFKMETFMDLLGVTGRRSCLPIVVCCSSRDELDAFSSAFATVPYVSLSPLYADLAEADRSAVLESFKQATIRWNPEVGAQSAVGSEPVKDQQKSHMIVVTDACLPLVASGESPLSARVLINYELPTKKEIYTRRMATCLAADGIVINMVVGGEVVTLRSIEESSNLVIAEMPINISGFYEDTYMVPYARQQVRMQREEKCSHAVIDLDILVVAISAATLRPKPLMYL